MNPTTKVSHVTLPYGIRARIGKCLRSPGIDVAWRAGTSNKGLLYQPAIESIPGLLKRFTKSGSGSDSIGHGDIADFCCGVSQLSGLNSGSKRPAQAKNDGSCYLL